jgi:FtsP/CotA-like multicopper oxidase with cupredoxin domain
VLRVKRGDELRVRLVNELSEETALHWHGIRGPNAMDGVPQLTQSPVAAGGRFDYRFTPPDAGTFWFHAAAPAQRDRGLSGALIVDEPVPPAVDHDAVLMFNDWPLAANGPPGADTPVTVNAQPAFDIPVKANQRLRLRLVNATRVAAMALRVEQHRATVVAIDGQPAEPFAPRDSRVALGPGNRVDLLADMTLAPGAAAPLTLITAQGERTIGRLVYDGGPAARAAPLPDPQPLPANPLPARIELRNAQRVDLPIERGVRPWMPSAGPFAAPLFSLKRGRTVVLALMNRMPALASLHLHGHHARLLDNLDDGWKPFWLDTVLVPPQQTARIAFVADNPGKWLLAAQPLQPDDPGMATWFEVT